MISYVILPNMEYYVKYCLLIILSGRCLANPAPALSVSAATIDFGGLPVGASATLDFAIMNTGGGTLSGTIESDSGWLTVMPESFPGNDAVVNVTADGELLYQSEGEYEGISGIYIYTYESPGKKSVAKFTVVRSPFL